MYALEPRLRALVRRELLAVEADPRSPGRGQYVFVQALTREVAYNTLARRDRKDRHLAAARFFESLGSDELAGALAGHYLAACQNTSPGPEAESLKERALVALAAAAERAAALGSSEQVLRFIDQALTLTADPAQQAGLLERAGGAASEAARHEAGEDYLGRALELHRATGDRVASARTTATLAQVLLSARQNARALAMLLAATAEFADLAPDPALVALEAQLARAYLLREDNVLAIETVDRVLDAAEHANLVPILADALVTKGSALDGLGRPREALAVIEAGERLARANGLTRTALRGLNNRLSSQWLIDPQSCVEDSREGLTLSGRIGSRLWAFTLIEKLGQALWLVGDWDAVVETLAGGMDDRPEPGDRSQFLYGSIRIRAARGEPVGVQLADLAATAAEVSDPQVLLFTVDAIAFTALAEGRLVDASEIWREGTRRYELRAHEWLYMAASVALRCRDAERAVRDLAELDRLGLHYPLTEARRAVLLAGLAALGGESERATGMFNAALHDLRDLGVPFQEALGVIVMASVLDPGMPDVQVAVERAREILLGLRAVPFLDQLEAAVQGNPGRG